MDEEKKEENAEEKEEENQKMLNVVDTPTGLSSPDKRPVTSCALAFERSSGISSGATQPRVSW